MPRGKCGVSLYRASFVIAYIQSLPSNLPRNCSLAFVMCPYKNACHPNKTTEMKHIFRHSRWSRWVHFIIPNKCFQRNHPRKVNNNSNGTRGTNPPPPVYSVCVCVTVARHLIIVIATNHRPFYLSLGCACCSVSAMIMCCSLSVRLVHIG